MLLLFEWDGAHMHCFKVLLPPPPADAFALDKLKYQVMSSYRLFKEQHSTDFKDGEEGDWGELE